MNQPAQCLRRDKGCEKMQNNRYDSRRHSRPSTTRQVDRLIRKFHDDIVSSNENAGKYHLSKGDRRECHLNRRQCALGANHNNHIFAPVLISHFAITLIKPGLLIREM